MRLIQVSMYYKPVIGGQQVIVSDIDKIAQANNFRSYILQPLNVYLIKKLIQSGSFGNVIPIFNPLSPLLLFKRLIFSLPYKFAKNIYEFIIWDGFNWGLFMFSRFVLRRTDIILVHYHYHLESLKSCPAAKIVFSHGVEWNRANPALVDKKKILSLTKILKSPGTYNLTRIIANDNDYIRICNSLCCSSQAGIEFSFLPNSVDINYFTSSLPKQDATDISSDIPRIVACVRNIRQDRGVLEAIRAMSILIEQDDRWQLLIAGAYKANDPYFLQCQKAASFTKGITFLGSLSRSQVLSLYRKASISIVPSQDKEGTSLAALESMAAGTPCISTNVGGLSDLPTFKSLDTTPEALAEATLKLYLAYSEERNRQLYATRHGFSSDAWARKLSDLIFST